MHGDDRGSIDRRRYNVYGTPDIPANRKLLDDSFKVYATRKLREENLLSREVKPWSRHGSTPYLWTEQLQRAIDYVINGQGDEPFF
ncbi:MAG: hypothetical protein DMF75_10645 [Acidobacteria bacterium]|nr:MAG: hypothetical protein DMF75_10645 [Acidobacteriota bacterium]